MTSENQMKDFSAEWAGASCLYNLCEKLVWMVHFYGAVLLVASL